MDNRASKFTETKIRLASALFAGECGGSYSEAVMVLSSTLSGMASLAWKGLGIDHNRFAEVLIKYASAHPHPSTISLPLLVRDLDSSEFSECGSILRRRFLNFDEAQILLGDDVDQTEEMILSICSTLPLWRVRRSSYASLLYSEVRSGYVHEYQTGERADPQPMTARPAGISYNNWLVGPHRRIVFHFPWLVDCAASVAQSIDKISHLPLDQPSTWWLEGK